MDKHKLRCLIYGLIGIAFGVINYLTQGATRGYSWGYWAFILAIWIIPSLAVAIYEIRSYGSKKQTTLASMLVWAAAVVAYYLYYLVVMLLDESVIGLDWDQVIFDFGGWCVAAVIGGAIVGLIVATICKTSNKSKS